MAILGEAGTYARFLRGFPGFFSTTLGLDQARATAERLRRVALDSIEPFGAAAHPLALFADFIVDRSR